MPSSCRSLSRCPSSSSGSGLCGLHLPSWSWYTYVFRGPPRNVLHAGTARNAMSTHAVAKPFFDSSSDRSLSSLCTAASASGPSAGAPLLGPSGRRFDPYGCVQSLSDATGWRPIATPCTLGS